MKRIAGAWYTRTNPVEIISKLETYYLYTDRSQVAFAQGTGRDKDIQQEVVPHGTPSD
ncbi:hypothetical protein [Mucilaginibacter pocheonensis]|uniref:Uncharacterized protein n=1 Tax=Mucilaginibacter pocheonensis TaxID=398050 RepID=A0ABU1THU6_9SPHI|nr:hypothetical protein [Mucilaginibacter pocheonensis]MDR6944816.1 hypothetical protein [Mucilaginibacter pocheonensis]